MKTQTISKGTFLVARPSLHQDIFNRSVILITEHGNEGSVGFVLNKPTGKTVRDYLQDFPLDLPLFEGGPVEQENIYFIHSRPELIGDSECIGENLFWSGNYDDIVYSLQNGLLRSDEIRFFLGYSGWSKGQLKTEMEGKSWSISRSREINVFNEWDSNLWRQEMERLGGRNLIWANSPNNPSLN